MAETAKKPAAKSAAKSEKKSGGGDLQLGDIVIVNVEPRSNNGSSEAAATVVRVLDTEDDRVNLRVLLDGDGDVLLRNVPVLSEAPEEPDEDDEDAEPVPSTYALRR